MDHRGISDLWDEKACPSGHGRLCQELPPDYEEKVTNFRKFTQTKIAENSIGPDEIINMDEVPLTCLSLGLLSRKVNRPSCWKQLAMRMHFTCVLSCTASGQKLPPMMIFKRMTMPKENLPKDIVVKVNTKGWMIESLMKEWLTECYGKWPGGFFHRKKALLVLDSMRAHITDSVKAAIKRTNSIPAVIPGGTTKYLQPLDISVNRAFKVALRVEWEAWMTARNHSPKLAACKEQLLLKSASGFWQRGAVWKNPRSPTGFERLDCCVMKRTAQAQICLETKVTLRATMKETVKVSDEVILRLFNSDTEDDFSGFSIFVEHSGQWLFW